MSTSDKHKKYDKLYDHIERLGIIYVISSVLFIILLNKFLLEYTTGYGFLGIEKFFTETIPTVLSKKDSNLITIAAVFIGIYFTIFTLLSSIGVESTFTILTRNNFEKLVRYIRNAFLGSFIYLFFSLFSNDFSSNWYYSIISLVFLLYMLLSALRFAFIIYLIFTRDVKKYYDRLEVIKIEKRELDNLYNRLDKFLTEEESKTQTNRSMEFSKRLKERNKK